MTPDYRGIHVLHCKTEGVANIVVRNLRRRTGAVIDLSRTERIDESDQSVRSVRESMPAKTVYIVQVGEQRQLRHDDLVDADTVTFYFETAGQVVHRVLKNRYGECEVWHHE